MKIALVSLEQVWEDKKANQILCSYYIEQASKNKVALIVFPEMTLTGFSMNTQLIAENPDQSETLGFFSQLAALHHISIAFGVVFTKGDKATNNFIVIDDAGNLLSSYAKIHPFSFSGENKYYLGGDKLIECKIDDAIIGLTICYDLRFPEIFQALSVTCNLIITIANWPAKRIKHWTTLLQARAIENQSFIAGVNRTGQDGTNLQYIESSAVFDPMGEKIVSCDSHLCMDIYDLSLSDVSTVRNSFPVKQDRKIEFYKTLL